MFNVIAAPGEVFDYVRHSVPSVGNWLAPALLAVVLGWISAAVVFSFDTVKQQLSEVTMKAVEKQVANKPPQEAEQTRAAVEKIGPISQMIGAYTTPVLMAFISPFLWGLFIWLVGDKVFHGGFPYMKAVETVGLSNMIGVLEVVLRTLLIAVMGSFWAAPNAALILMRDFDPQKPLHAILAAVNVMTFWLLAVRSVGLSKLSGASVVKSAIWVFGFWFLYTSLLMGFGFAMQAVFSGAAKG
jgi:VIT1/CCC1 family predicted Fe2+/Mn2+ transporter